MFQSFTNPCKTKKKNNKNKQKILIINNTVNTMHGSRGMLTALYLPTKLGCYLGYVNRSSSSYLTQTCIIIHFITVFSKKKEERKKKKMCIFKQFF